MMNKKFGQTKPKTIVGIDYSLTSPAICVNNIDDNKIKFYYLTTKKKWLGKQSDNIIGYEHKECTDHIERFKNISDFILDILYTNPLFDQPDYQIFIEGYSYGSKGQGLFQIAENCGILKYRLQDKGYIYNTVVPSGVKKGATGEGNADKDMMYESFLKETKINLKKILDTEKTGNPLSDIVDSYYIQKVGYENKSS